MNTPAQREKLIHTVAVRLDDPLFKRIAAYQEARYREDRAPLSVGMALRELVSGALDAIDSARARE